MEDYNEWCRFGFLIASYANMHRKKGVKAYTIGDFIKNPNDNEKTSVEVDIEKKQQEYEELKELFGA